VSIELKKNLAEKRIFSKFSILGMGNYFDSKFLADLIEIGTERGLYK
jgi:hypothetical protein